MATANGQFPLFLIKVRLVSKEQAKEADKVARQSGTSFAEAAVKLGYATSEDVTKAMAKFHGMEFIDLSTAEIPPSVLELVPESLARENAVLPFSEENGSLRVIVSRPDDFDTLEKLRFVLNRNIEVALAPRETILEAVNRYYGFSEGESSDSMLQEFTDTAIDFTETEEESKVSSDEIVDETSAPVVRLVQLVINEAVQLRASDIHIEPFENRIRIRYRIDGVLVERDNPPKRLLGSILSRVKILAKMDIAERRRPQDGRIKITAADKELDLRVSVLPTAHGQSVVMRILDKDSIRIGVRQLGLSEEDNKVFNGLIRRPNGIILVTGPTGSGKTTTLYAALNDLNRPDRKIITAEDPVEYYLPGINQVEVKHDIGLDFARIIRAMLRQAPNVILVGEMRDQETAEMGIQASLTGHLVFSTLHTNDAPGAVTRMIDMGVPSYLVATSVIGVLSQRLIRITCSKCKQPYTPTDALLEMSGITPEQAAKATFMRGKGCGACQRTGYRGRLGIFEMMQMTAKIRELTFQGASTLEIRKASIAQGMRSLYKDGLLKACRGLTTIDEVYRVAKQVGD